MPPLTRVWTQRGLPARMLLPLAALYAALAALRRHAYRQGWLRTERLPVPVLVVGNLIAGGAGKTPAVIASVEQLRRDGWLPGIVSRGYGRLDDAVRAVETSDTAALVGDEPLLLRLRTGAPVFVGRDRPAAARALLRAHPQVDVIVSDDGLQHLALGRDAAVIVFDDRGAGNGWLLPAGPLREPMPRTLPAHSVVLYNAARASTPLPGFLAARSLAGAVELEAWWAGRKPSHAALQALTGRTLLAAAGMAQPQRFFDMLCSAGLNIVPLALPDHHDYARLPWPAGTAEVIVTEKDAVKLRPQRLGATRVWVAALDFVPDAAYGAALSRLLAPHRPA